MLFVNLRVVTKPILFSIIFHSKIYLRNRLTRQLTAPRLDIYPAPHADRTRDPSLLQRFFELNRTLTIGRRAGVAGGGVEGNGVDMTHQALQA